MFELPALYPIIDIRRATPGDIDKGARLAERLATAGAALLQLRAKTLEAGPLTALAARLVPVLAAHGCRLVVNDRADVAAASGAAGVHLGDTDLPVAAARELLGSDAIIGYSTHEPGEVRAEVVRGANYLGFGPVFESPTKPGVRSARGVAQLTAACAAADLPVVAIGGITLATAAQVWRAGAASIAVIREIEISRVPADLVRAYRESRDSAKAYSAG